MSTEPYRIQIRGRGLDSCLEIWDHDDLEILDKMIAKIRGALLANNKDGCESCGCLIPKGAKFCGDCYA